ncbi:helix-turn-helix domain-containing protein [Microcoleus sp. S13_B4]|uniref:helix-turn-helix domain-containing protein n=1 Tax=Microcoleus sp. S13_B4 TaxID=3055408 RepID=UPI002FD1D0C3
MEGVLMLDETEISSTSEDTKKISQINLIERMLDLYKQGLTYQDIAKRLQIREPQVKHTLVYHPAFSQFLDLYKQGFNYHDIAEQYQLSQQQVRQILVNNPAFNLYLIENVVDLYEQGHTYQDIADWHQISEERVRKILYNNSAFGKFLDLYKQGHTYQDIAHRSRTSEQQVRKILNSNPAFNEYLKDLKESVMQALDCNSESHHFLDLYKQGHTYEDIAEQYQISKQQVRKILNSNPAFNQYRKDLTESVRQILDSNSGLSHHFLELYKQELTYKEIGDRHQISQRQVMYILDKSSAYHKYVRERDKKKVAEPAIVEEEKAEQFKKNLYLKSLDVLYPERVRELWDYRKNGNLKPEEIYTVTNILIWLKCPLDGYSWTKQLDHITAIWEKGTSGCPECASFLAHSESPSSSSLPDERPSKLLEDSSNSSSSNGNELLGSTPDSSLVGSACDLPGKPPSASPLFSGLANELPSKLLDDSSNGSSSNLFKGTEVEETQTFKEGSSRQVRLNRYERNPQARKKCIEFYGTDCWICGFDFEKVFGEKGKGLIHVHHLIPLSKMNKEYEVNPREDLRPVCPNCHAMIHRKNPPYSIEELKSLLNGT